MPENHYDCIKCLQEAQEVEFDNREMVREADLFLNKRDGQWEPKILDKWVNRPRYTFDECNPIVDDIMGEMEGIGFDVRVEPAGGLATKQMALNFGGIIRQIESISRAREIYNDCARITVGTGFSAWRVVTGLRDGDSFQQDLMIRMIPNAQDSVWFDPGAVRRDMADADMSWVLSSLTWRQYHERWPEGSGTSIGRAMLANAYSHKKPHEVIVGEYLYKKQKKRELALLTNGAVVEVTEEFGMIYDELQKAGIQVHKTKTSSVDVVCQRFFDGSDWLTGSKESVFMYIPIVPVYGNFRISEDKVIYWGAVEKLMDAQRIINYSESRKIEEGALAPKGKVWMSKEQAASTDVKRTLQTLNTNNDPVQFYDAVEGQNPPAYVGSPASNPGLMETTQAAQNFVQRTSGTFDEARGTAPPRRSGIAIQHLQNKSDNPKKKWVTAVQVAISHTYEILIRAIPKVYDMPQQMRILGFDGTEDKIVINQTVRDEQTGRLVTINDLSAGKYGVTCVPGPSFYTRQQETVAAITEYAQIDQSILQFGADILLNNINSPGMEKLAARKRRQMVLQGLIPPDQMTEEEKKMFEQVQSQDNMSPLDRANLMIAQAQLAEVQGRNKERSFKLQLDAQKLELQENTERSKAMIQMMETLTKHVEAQARTLKLIREASGLAVMPHKGVISAFEEQVDDLRQAIKTN